MKVALGCDHAGFALKEHIKSFLGEKGITCLDVGTHNSDSVDYPVYGMKVARLVSGSEYERGILVCGSGIGMSIVANRFHNVRAALCNDTNCARLSRQHNDANILVLGARTTDSELALDIVKAWLEADFERGRHESRIKMIDELAGNGRG